MPMIEGNEEFWSRWRLVYAPEIPGLLSVDPTVGPLKSLASNISFATEVEVQLGKTSSGVFQANSLICFRYCCNSHLIFSRCIGSSKVLETLLQQLIISGDGVK
ncbi:hypothetical protein ABKV19_006841 [Rosa sericea]